MGDTGKKQQGDHDHFDGNHEDHRQLKTLQDCITLHDKKHLLNQYDIDDIHKRAAEFAHVAKAGQNPIHVALASIVDNLNEEIADVEKQARAQGYEPEVKKEEKPAVRPAPELAKEEKGEVKPTEEFNLEPSEATPQEQAALRGEKKAELPKGERPSAKIPEEKIQPATTGKAGMLFEEMKGPQKELFEQPHAEKGEEVEGISSLGAEQKHIFPSHPSASAITKHLDPILKRLPGMPKVYVVENWDNLPDNIKTFYKEQGKTGTYSAMFVRYHNGKRAIIIIADRQASKYSALKSLWHEGGHFALRKALREGSPEYKTFLDDLYNSKFKLQIIDHAQKRYKEFDLNTPEGQRSAADEWWAKTVAEENFAQRDPWIKRMWDRFVAIVQKFLKKIGLGFSMTHAEIRDMMRRSFEELKKEQAKGVPTGEVAGASGQKDIATIKDHYNVEHEVPVLVNPSRQVLKGLLNRSKEKEIRVMIGPDGTTYAWDAYLSTHADIADFYGFSYKDAKMYDIPAESFDQQIDKIEALKQPAISGQKLLPSETVADISGALDPELERYLDNALKDAKESTKDLSQAEAEKLKEAIETDTVPTEADRPKIPSAYEKAQDDWFGNKDWAVLSNSVENKKLQEQIKGALGKKRYDKEAQDIDQAIHIYLDLKRNPGHREEYYDQLTPEQKHIVDLTDEIEKNPELTKVADYIRKQYDEVGQKALEAGVIYNAIDNYAARAWKQPQGKSATELLRKFGTTTRHAKHRVFETILQGQALTDATGKHPFELQIKGATNNVNILKDEIARTIEDKRLISVLKRLTWKDTDLPVISHSKLNEDYQQIEHPNFSYWFPSETIKGGKTSKVKGSSRTLIIKRWAVEQEGKERAKKVFDSEDDADYFISQQEHPEEFHKAERTVIMEKKQLWAPSEVAKDLNVILGRSKLKGIKVIDWATKYNALFKSTILMTSFFHHQAFMRSYLLGTRHKTGEQWHPLKMYKAGRQAIDALGPEIELGVRNGLTLGKVQDWEEEILAQESTLIGRIIDRNAKTKAAKDWLTELRDRQARFLFGNFGAGLKAMAYLIEYRNAIKEHPNMAPNQRAKMVAELVNDDFGGLHLQRMKRNPTTQHIFRLLALAPDWTESNVQTMVKAFHSGEKAKSNLYRRFWLSILTKGLTATFIANFLLSLGDDKNALDRFKEAWRSGNFRWLDIDITPLYRLFGGKQESRKYFSILGHFKDPMKFITHPIRSAHNKGSVLYRTFHEAMVGVDWRGHSFTTLDELLGIDDKGLYLTNVKGKHRIGEPKGGKFKGQATAYTGKTGPISIPQIPSYVISQLRGWTPIQVQNFIGWTMGEVEAWDAISSSLGVHGTPIYPPSPARMEERLTQEYVDLRKAGKPVADLRKWLDGYNTGQKGLGEKGQVIKWSTVVNSAMNRMKAERAAERMKEKAANE